MSLITIPSLLAALETEPAAPPVGDPAFCVQLSPALAPAARTGRAVVPGTFPVWLQQTDGNAPTRRVLVQSWAPIYFGKGSGRQWQIIAPAGSVPAGTDLAFDVTYGDDPGDWLEVSAAPAGPRFETLVHPLLGEHAAPGANIVIADSPAWARGLAVMFESMDAMSSAPYLEVWATYRKGGPRLRIGPEALWQYALANIGGTGGVQQYGLLIAFGTIAGRQASAGLNAPNVMVPMMPINTIVRYSWGATNLVWGDQSIILQWEG